MPHKFDTRMRHMLLSDERYEALRPKELLRSLGLKAGDTMADIGCGPGFFTLPAAEIVGKNGVVLAGDVQGEMLSTVKSRVSEAGLTNVHVLKTSETDIPLPASSCNLVLLAFVLNEVSQRASFLHKSARLLRPNGRVAVLEWLPREGDEGAEGPPQEDRIAPEMLTDDAQAAGLHLSERRDLNDDQYLCVLVPSKP